MKVIITGKNGQLGQELENSLPEWVDAYSYDSTELDISNRQDVNRITASIVPDVIINAAAYTAVDRAETDQDAAFNINEAGVKNLAVAANNIGAHLIHISTDFVFDASKNTPYEPSDKTNPLGVYGESKLAGERAALSICKRLTIIRTSWVYSAHGNNFVKTMLRLMAQKDTLSIVADQIGSPTWAKGLAQLCWIVIKSDPQETIYHWSDMGVASWYDFAVAIQELAFDIGLLKNQVELKPIRSSQYPTPAKRPSFSVMDTSNTREEFNLSGQHWQHALKRMLTDLKNTVYVNS